ncbi:uncharacterized protein LOC119374351 [Rhipicephalus sanguineus]|uniref:Uncharacterized protein n=1 Tax=Rhipicephalus sanguineus TaxID=34632 RepID=A0A9D4QBJ5_RHISA|nr:uncharacterized protein LOC119374351 [Rhipicephalus sanguineus]KAH7971698.1 hypothetical protein HPB52_002355 [Rhipicephalus sanguineus]
MSRSLKHSKVFDDSKGRFFLVLLTEEDDARLSKLSLSITDGNNVWKATTSFEESCGSLNSRREENVKHLIRRVGNCRLETCDETDELSVMFVPPGKTYELKFKKATGASAAIERLDLLVAVADAGDLKTLVDSADNDALLVAPANKRSKSRKEAAPVEKEGMSLLNPRSRKIPTKRGIDFD